MKKNGFMLIELIIAMGIFSIVIFSTLEVFIASQTARGIGTDKVKATYLINEYFESLKNIRRQSWNNLTNGRFIISTSTGSAILQPTTTGEVVGNYTRFLDIADAYRDNEGNLVDSGGTIDPSTKKNTITISWGGLYPRTISQFNYLTRYLDNLTWEQTTEIDFNKGILGGTTVTNVDGGEVQLGAGGGGDWCKPNLSINALDLPWSGITTAISATTLDNMDFAYTTTGGNASGNSMDSVMINHENPPVATNNGSYNYYKTYGIYVDYVNQYTYLTSDHPSLTVDIVQVSNKPYTQVGTYLSLEGGRANSIYVAYNSTHGHEVGYVTAGDAFRIFDLSNKTGPRPELGHIHLSGTGKRIVVVGDYAYVAISNNIEQLNIVDVKDPSNPSLVSSINVGNGQPATDLFVNDTGKLVYLITSQSSTKVNDFFIIDTSNKVSTLPAPLGSYNTGSMNPLGITVVPGNIAIIVGSGGNQYQVLRIIGNKPSLCGYLTNPNGATAVNAITSVLRSDGNAFSYILTNSSGAEFQSIMGGPGGKFATSGTFESQTYDTGHQTAFNRFFTTINFTPGVTNIKFQIAVKDSINGDCQDTSFGDLDFIGPDGSPYSYFTSDNAAIPLNDDGVGYENPGQCFRFRSYLETTDALQTPIFYDFTVNYSP